MIVGDIEGVALVLGVQDGDQGTEDFLAGNSHVGGDVGEDMRGMSRPPVTGVPLAGLITAVLPRAEDTERCDRCSGKFQGLITPTPPTGFLYRKI